MPKIMFKVDLLAPEKFPSEILVGLVREYNEPNVTVSFPSSKSCLIEADEIKVRKSDIEKALNLKLPYWNVPCITNTTLWQKTVFEIDGVMEATENELIIKPVKKVPVKTNKRKLIRVPVGLRLPANIKTEKEYVIFGQITDLSKEGVGVTSSILPELDQTIEISFEFNIGLKFENVKAQVAWQRNDLQRFGARWIDLKEEHWNVLKHLTPD